MRFPVEQFNKIPKNNPCWSDWLCFVETIKDIDINRRQLRKYFNKLVDKDDYVLEEKNELIDFLMSSKKGVYSP